MRKNTSILLGELQGIMSGYVALLNYKYLNLCVKAEAASLLAVTVEYDDESLEIEQAADITMPQDNQLQVYPKDPVLLFAIGKAIAEVHPEFKQDIVTEKEDGRQEDDEDSAAGKSILLTMPAVNKDRRDLLIEGVDGLYEATRVKLEGYATIYTQKMMRRLAGAMAEEIDEAKQAMEELRKQHLDLAKQYHDNKTAEIEKAYELYVEQQNEKAAAQQEQEAATNKDAGMSFKMQG